MSALYSPGTKQKLGVDALFRSDFLLAESEIVSPQRFFASLLLDYWACSV